MIILKFRLPLRFLLLQLELAARSRSGGQRRCLSNKFGPSISRRNETSRQHRQPAASSQAASFHRP